MNDPVQLQEVVVGAAGAAANPAAQQRFGLGIAGGLLGASIGAAAWAAITVATDYQIGYMAIGVGALAGVGTRLWGRGTESRFGVVGAGLALLGCLVGNLLAAVIIVSRQASVSFGAVLGNGEVMVALMGAWFSPMDLLFYGIAMYEGYRFAFRPAPLTLPAPLEGESLE